MNINKKTFIAGFVFGLFFLVDSYAFAQIACKRVVINQLNSGQVVTIDNTAGGIKVVNADSNRCSLTIHNFGANAMTCAPTTLTVTATVGWIIGSGGILSFSEESSEEWRCISSAGTTAQIAEGKP